MLNSVNELLLAEVAQSQITVSTVFLVLIIATVLGFATSWVYQRTFKGVSYSASFVSSLIILNLITATVMLVIGSNLARAFGLIGALSIIRFRTAIKDPKDIVFIFLSLVLGLATGTQNYHIAVATATFTLFLVYVLDRVNYGTFSNSQYFLSIKAGKQEFNEENVRPVLDRYTSSYNLNSLNSVFGDNEKIEAVYRVNIKSEKNKHALIDGISSIKDNWRLSLISTENYVEY